MTREEAIFHLKQFKKRLHLDDTEEYIINTDSIDMAIEALSEPTKTDKKTLQRPRECVNAGCDAMCSPEDYKLFAHLFGDNPKKCPNYRLGKLTDTLAEIRAEIIDKYMTADGRMGSVSADIIKIIDKHIGKE